MAAACDSLADDPSALKAIILAQRDEISRLTATEKAFDALVQALKIRIARLQKQKFGPSSEKIEREIDSQIPISVAEVRMAKSSGWSGRRRWRTRMTSVTSSTTASVSSTAATRIGIAIERRRAEPDRS